MDYDRDGHLDLFVASYLNTTIEKLPKPGENADCRWKSVPVNCGPRGLPTGFVQLFHNNGDGTFRDVSRESGVAAASGAYPMTAVVVDVDNDGWPDVYVACDSTPSWLFRNQKDGTFREEGLERGVALSEDGMEQAGMGLGIGDFDLDGHPDIFKTHFADDTNVLYGTTARLLRRLHDSSRHRRRDEPSDGEPGWWTSIMTASLTCSSSPEACIPRWSERSRPIRREHPVWCFETSATADSS